MQINKTVLFLVIVVGGTVLDIATKTWAEHNLASMTEWDRVRAREAQRTEPLGERLPFLYRTVTEDQAGQTSREWIQDELNLDPDSPFGQRTLISLFRVLDEGYVPDRGFTYPESTARLLEDEALAAGDIIEIRHRSTVVVPGFWNHIYVRNPGAAWGMFAQRDESFRRPFFVGVSILAVLFVGFVFVKTPRHQVLLLLSLSSIISGALGNLIDRVRYGYVVDFLDWYVTWGGQERHWPTSNVADVFIAVGVGLMFLEILRGGPYEEDPAATKDAKKEEGATGSEADASPVEPEPGGPAERSATAARAGSGDGA